jgi:hypothetical protein
LASDSSPLPVAAAAAPQFTKRKEREEGKMVTKFEFILKLIWMLKIEMTI